MSASMKLRVLVAEDEPLILKSITRKIDDIEASDGEFHVVGTAQDGECALRMIDQYYPDVLITDIHMPIIDGLSLIQVVYSKYPNIMMIIISGFNDFKYAQIAIKYGVKDYLLKPVKKDELSDTLLRIRISMDARSNNHDETAISSYNGIPSANQIASLVEMYIKENYRNEINFDQIAQKFNFNASYLSKIFTRHIGENPSKHLISLRINEAKRLLTYNQKLSVKEIGELVGYSDQFHFSHIFKLVSGKSPTDFRKEYCLNIGENNFANQS